jgi:hypothetical protein
MQSWYVDDVTMTSSEEGALEVLGGGEVEALRP